MNTLELWLRAASALALIALVLGALKYVVRGVPRAAWPRRRGRLLDVVETLPLANAAVLHVVRVGERYFVVAGGQGHLRRICEVPGDAVAPRVAH